MNMEDLGYFLFMQSEEIKRKKIEDLTESEKVNLELNPYMESVGTTQGRKSSNPVENPKNIAPPKHIKKL